MLESDRPVQVWVALVTVVSVALANEGFLEEPSNQTVHAGDTVTLSCLIQPPRQRTYAYVYWYKSFGFTDTPSMPISSERVTNTNVDRRRYSVVGSNSRYDLQIADVEVGDTSYYMCKYYTGEYFDSQIARLTVYDDTLVPQCRFNPQNPDVGTTVTIRCLPGIGDTFQSLTLWRGENGHQITNVARQSDGSITHRLKLKANDNNRSYTCVFGRNFQNVHNCSVKPLVVTPTISLTPAIVVGVLDDQVRLSCFARGLPRFTTYKWMVGTGRNALKISQSMGRYIFSTNGDSARLTISNLRNSDNNTAIRCIASNNLGHRITALGKVVVQFLPTITRETMPPEVATSTTPYVVSKTDSLSVSKGLLWKNIPTFTEAKKPFVYKPEPDSEYQNETVNDSRELGRKDSYESQSSSRLIKVLVPLLVIVGILLIAVIIILLFYIRKTDRESPEAIKRLSLKKPAILKRLSVSRPQFLDNISLRKSWQDAKQKVETLQKVVTRRSQHAEEEKGKRQSLRDHQIQVVVNPPPPEWQLKVQDVDKAQRERMLSYRTPSSEYSSKEKDLLDSLLTGRIKMKSLERTATDGDVKNETEDVDSQVESDFEEDDFCELPESGRGSTEKKDSCLKKKNKSIEATDEKGTNKDSLISKGSSTYVKKKGVDNETKSPEMIYANSDAVTKRDTTKNGSAQENNPSRVAYAELDLKLTGPWDEKKRSQSEAKTAYAVIDHTKKHSKVESICE